MPNAYKNKVVYNGNTLIDISDTTAVAVDVLSGKEFYLANGAKAQGTQVVHSITQTLTNVTSSNGSIKIFDNGEFATELTPADGYLINSITVTMGGVDITDQVFTGYTSPAPIVHEISETLTNVVSTNQSEKVLNGEQFYCVLTTPEGYFINNVVVTMGGADVTDFVFTGSTDSSGGYVPTPTPAPAEITLQSKTVSITPSTTAQNQTVTADSGYDGLEEVGVTVAAMPSGSAATPATSITANPTISVSAAGLITASVSGSQNVTPTVSPGYVSSGTAGTISVSGSQTQQLTTQAATSVTPSDQTQTVGAAGRYMTGAVTVNPIPSQYIVPSGSQTFTENGTFDVTAIESAIVNVPPGLEYESGTWTPDEDVARGTVSFSNTHTEAPSFIMLADATGTAHSVTNSNYSFAWFDYFKAFGYGVPYSSSGFRYATAFFNYRGTSTSSISTGGMICSQKSSTASSSGTSYPRYWATESAFYPYSNNTSRYWRAGRTYKWVAIWFS